MIGVNYLFDREITNVIEVMVLMSLYTIFLVFGIDCYKVFLFFGKVWLISKVVNFIGFNKMIVIMFYFPF